MRWFPTLALATALLTVGLIVFGAVVRVTDSGLGCGNHWPLCNGTIFPPLDNITAWIEWLHRLFALLIGIMGIVTLIVAIRNYRQNKRIILYVTVLAALLYVGQAGLGAAVVIYDLTPALVTLHLAMAMLLLGALLAAGVIAVYKPERRYTRDSFTILAYVTTALSFVIILTGALVRGSGATLACPDFPLCNGAVFPFDQGTLQTIHMLHRFAVAALGVALILLVWSAWSNRHGGVRTLAALALVFYLTQAAVGAMLVLSGADAVWGAGHVGFASATWAALIGLSVIESMNSAERLESEWHPQSELLPS